MGTFGWSAGSSEGHSWRGMRRCPTLKALFLLWDHNNSFQFEQWWKSVILRLLWFSDYLQFPSVCFCQSWVSIESLHVESGQIRILTTKRRGGQAVSPFFTVFFLRSRTGEIDLLKTSPKNNYINRSDKFGKPSLIAVTLNHRKAA